MQQAEQTRLSIRVKPNARCNDVSGLDEDILLVSVAAPPVKGKANRELVSFLSEMLHLRKSDIVVEKGATSRRKRLLVKGLTRSQIMQRLGLYGYNLPL